MRKSKLANRTSGGGTKYTIDQFSDSLGIVNNQKGFAISSMLYTILLLFLVLLMGVLGLLGTRKIILDKMKNEIATDINGQNKIVLKLDYRNALVANTSKVPNFSFVPTDIASVVDENGNKINGASISYDSKPTFDSTKNGSYTITYTGAYRGKSVTGTTTITVIDPVSYDYLYAPKEQVFKAPGDGLYQFQLWGAEGNASFGGVGGKGAYTSGNIPLTKDENIYVRIGGMMGYNGGGWTSALPNAPRGGGASDIRLDPLDRLDMISIGSVTECRASGGKMCITGTSGIVDTVTLGQNSVLYGPYKHYKAGIYLVTITGTHLDQLTYRPNISTEFAPDGVYHAFTFTPVTQLDTLYQYLLYLEKDYDNVELYMRNDTTTSATVEAVDIENIGSRIMVAAGGGGSERKTGGAGGTLNGFQSNELYETLVTNNGGGATQTSGGIKGTGTNAKYTYGGNGYFGVGGQGGIISYDQGPGGGGGYYGGGGISFASSGGGGSSFISGYPGCNAIREYPNTGAIVHTGQPNHYSGYTFSNAVMKAGNETMPNYGNIATMTGNRGHGYGKVTPLIIENGIVASNLVTNSGFEGELNNWKPTVGAVFTTPKSNSFESEKSIQLDMLATAGTYQNLDQKFIIGTDVFIGHKYYAREWYQILNEDDSGLKFYSEIVYQNSSNGYITTAGNFFKATTSRTSNWEMGSFLFTLNDGVDYNQIALRPLITNNIKGVGSARADAVVLLDLTAIYGAGKEPDKAWCDTHIPYFEGTWILPKNS